jgi:hypothetical protein
VLRPTGEPPQGLESRDSLTEGEAGELDEAVVHGQNAGRRTVTRVLEVARPVGADNAVFGGGAGVDVQLVRARVTK